MDSKKTPAQTSAPSNKAQYRLIEGEQFPIKAWVKGVGLEPEAERQLRNAANLPFIFKWIAVMPDVHWGMGATVGSVIPTRNAIIPAAVGVDIGCGMMAVKTSLKGSDLPENLKTIRTAIERAVPHGRTGGGGRNDRGSYRDVPKRSTNLWGQLEGEFSEILLKHPKVKTKRYVQQLGTLGSGNHFVEVCLDEDSQVWFMLHSGSRGIGNRIGMYFIEKARKDMIRQQTYLPDDNLAYFPEGSPNFADYVQAVEWAQNYAATNRQIMMENMIDAIGKVRGVPRFKARLEAINCHHNYVTRETHFGEEILVTRKGAVKAGLGDMGIIPGSMGACSYIVRGLGQPDSFNSCSHGAGRLMSRTAARKKFTIEDHVKATEGVECRKDKGVLDETPGAYKPIEKVMAAQSDLVDIVYTLRQIVCVKG
jgi:tRNA-splicing ligase RtcB (3'-phosphate/5'-hydroxy nucleic acid ligase)